jgi:predicted small integral membrane protein
MMTRFAKVLLLGGIALYCTLVVFNNLTDFGSNEQFVRHVLAMDTTIPGNGGMWRAISSPAVQLAFYVTIIAWEAIASVILWWGVVRLARVMRRPARAFNAARPMAILALTISMLLWLTAFLTIGGEWFLMWQSHTWNGQGAAFRNFTVFGIVLLILLQPEAEVQP